MEIPIIGRFFKGNKANAEVPQSLPKDIQAVSTPPEIVPPVSETTAPDIDREHITRTIREHKSWVRSDPQEKEFVEKAKSALKEATPELLEEMARTVDPDKRKPNLLREGDRIIIGWKGAHMHCALAANMTPEDAGTIMKDPDRPTEPILLVMDGSGGFHIVPGNRNRPKTLEVLRQMAPNVIFEERVTSVGKELLSMFGPREPRPPRQPRPR